MGLSPPLSLTKAEGIIGDGEWRGVRFLEMVQVLVITLVNEDAGVDERKRLMV